MAFSSIAEDTREWYDTVQSPGLPTSIVLPEPDADYAYAAARLLSWFPVVNSKGATYFAEDFDYDLLQTLIGKQANLEHDKTRIIGTIFAFDVTTDGIDIGVRIDRECADLQGMDMSDLRSGNYFDSVSVELTRNPNESWFLAVDDGFNIQNKIPVNTGRNQGIRRTTAADPYKLMGNRVVERIKPARFTGVGFVPNPADATAKLFAVAASDTSEEREIPQSAPTDNAVKETQSVNEAEMKARIEALEADVARLTQEKEQASAEAAGKAELATELAQVKDTLQAKETELASVTAERDALVTANAEREKAARVDAIVAELEAIKPCKDDAERTALRETAAMYSDDAGRLHVVKLERTVEAQAEQLAALQPPADEAAAAEAQAAADAAAAAEAAAAQAAADAAAASAGQGTSETASGDLPFTAKRPKVAIGPAFIAQVSKKTYSKEELADVF